VNRDTDEIRRRLVAQSLRVGNPVTASPALPAVIDPREDSPIELRIDQIHEYEHNPRRIANAKFAEIKESIRAVGLRNPLTVTRRPGETHFIVEAGGNTRLLALKELWAETRDARFGTLTALFRPWRAESHVLTAHLIENEQRGDLTYWDKASGIMALRTLLEKECGGPLSLSQLEEELRGLGYRVSKAALGFHAFAVQRLGRLGEALPFLTGDVVKRLQQRFNRLKRYAELCQDVTEADLSAEVIEPVLEESAAQCASAGSIDPEVIDDRCAGALARFLCRPAAAIRSALEDEKSWTAVAPFPPLAADAIPLASITTAPASSPGFPDPVSDLVRKFAGLTGIDPWVDWTPAGQYGFRLKTPHAPSDSHNELISSDEPRRRAQRVLRYVVGQGGEGGDTPPSVQEQAEQALLTWLLDRDDRAAGVFVDVIRALRRSSAHPQGASVAIGVSAEKGLH